MFVIQLMSGQRQHYNRITTGYETLGVTRALAVAPGLYRLVVFFSREFWRLVKRPPGTHMWEYYWFKVEIRTGRDEICSREKFTVRLSMTGVIGVRSITVVYMV